MQPEIIFITASTKEATGVDNLLDISPRRTKTWLRERLTPSAWVRMMGEGLVGDYSAKMDILREVDDNIHEWTKDLDFIGSELDKALKASRIVDVGILLKDLNDRLRKVSIEGIRVEEVAEEALHQFDKEDQEYVFNKGAGIIDDLKRRWVSNKLETSKRKLRGRALKSIIDFAKSIVKAVDSQLNLMSKARAGGDIGKYIDALHKIGELQKRFQEKFFPIYDEYLKDIVDESFAMSKKDIKEESKEDPSVVPINTPTVEVKSPAEEPTLDLLNRKLPNLEAPAKEVATEEPQEIIIEETSPIVDEEKMPESVQGPLDEEKEEDTTKKALERMRLKEKHANFLNSLAKLAEVDHKEAVQFMFSYAKKIAAQDPQTSWKLLAVAEGFVE